MFDASVWVSALAYPTSIPARAVDQARLFVVRSVISEPLVDQIRRALLSPRFGWSAVRFREAEAKIRDLSDVVQPTMRLAVITAKESDNRILECAVAGRAAFIVTGDRKHLLPVGEYAGIRIVSPAEFLDVFTR